jgi:hypothetical protein
MEAPRRAKEISRKETCSQNCWNETEEERSWTPTPTRHEASKEESSE